MAPKLSSRAVVMLSATAASLIFVSSYMFMDLASKQFLYVKVENETYNCESGTSDFSCDVGDDFIGANAVRDTSSSKGDTEVDFELSTFTEQKGNIDKNERLPTAKDAEEGFSLLNMRLGSDDVQLIGKNASHRHFDPQVYVDLYEKATVSQKGSMMKIVESRPIIFIMAQWRFGSSVFGELFNQNPDLFYLFEPLWTTKKLGELNSYGRLSPEFADMSRNILRKLSKCQYSDDFVAVFNSWGGRNNNGAICRASSQCRLISPRWVTELCKKYKGRVATKLIRADLDLLKPLVVDDKINLKIIHLVRDPRGSALSRINYRIKLQVKGKQALQARSKFLKLGRLKALDLFNVTPETSQTVRGMCQWIRENAIVSPDLLPPWLQGRYYLVRYEDFADTPLKVTRELYRFVGIPFPKEVQNWVVKNTHAEVSNKQVFSTRKNSHAAATHWMRELSKLEIKQIEEECMDVLNLMDYAPYDQLIDQQTLR